MADTNNSAYSLSEESQSILNNPEKKAKVDAFRNSKQGKLGSEITKQIAQQIFDDEDLSKVRKEEKTLRKEKRNDIKERDVLQKEVAEKQMRLDELNTKLSGEVMLSPEEIELNEQRLRAFEEQKAYDLENSPKDEENEYHIRPQLYNEIQSFCEKVKRTKEYIQLPSGLKIPSVEVQNLVVENTFTSEEYEPYTYKEVFGTENITVKEPRKDALDAYEEEHGELVYEYNGVTYRQSKQKMEDILTEIPGNTPYERRVALLGIGQQAVYGDKWGEKNTDGSRQCLLLSRTILLRSFSKGHLPYHRCGLFLVGEW